MMERQPPIFTTKLDLGRWAYEAIRTLGLRMEPYLGPETGIVVEKFGGMSMLDYLHQIVAMSWGRDGNRWTIMPSDRGIYQMTRKDRETISGTVYVDDARTVATLSRDFTEEPNRIYMTGVTPEGQRVRFGQYPGLKQSPAPPYPFNDGRTFGEGTTNAQTDTGDGITILINRLRVTRYMNAENAPGNYDRDVTRAIRELQRDAGLNVTGNVNLRTWSALYDLDATGFSLRWSSIQPAAAKSVVRKWRKSASGAQMGRNPNYDSTIPKVDRNVDVGAGFSRADMREWARNELDDSGGNDWVGSIVFNTGALVKGAHTPGDALTDEKLLRARDIRPGMNLRLPLFAGGITVHVSAVSVDANGTVRVDADTRARDAMEVWAIIARNRESRRSPYREWLRQHRSSTQTKDSQVIWDEVGGILGDRVRVPAKTWTVFPVVAGQEGTVSRLALDTNPPREFAVAIFGKRIYPARLRKNVSNPLSAAGRKAWASSAVRSDLAPYILLYAAGTDAQPCGYWPARLNDEDGPTLAAITGKWRDDASFPYRTADTPVLWVAVYSAGDTWIPAGRIMWPLLEAGT